MKKKFLTLALSSFCIFSMVGCAGGSNNSSNNQSDSGSNQPSTTMKITVTFYMNDGTNSVHDTKEVDYGTKTTSPSTPKRDGFKFRGWYVDPDCLIKYNFTTLLKSNTSLYALWEEKVVDPDQGGGNEGGGDTGGGESEGGELGGVDVSTITTGAIITRGEVTTGFELALNEGATGPDNLLGEYFVEGLNLKAGDKISFKFEGNMITTGIGAEGDEDHPNNAINTATPEAPAFEIVKDAKANVYFKSWQDGGFSFFVTGNDKAPDPDTGGGNEGGDTGGDTGGEVVTTTANLVITSGAESREVALTKNEGATGPENLTGEYLIEGLNLKAGDKLTFKINGEAITTKIGAEAGDENNHNNATNVGTNEAPEFEVVKTAESANVYFKTWADGGYSFWVTGNNVAPNPNPDSGDTGGGQETTSTTYTATGLPNWLYNDNCVLFAWVWGPENPGKWIATEGSGTSLTFTVDSSITGFKLVRFKSGTINPSWDLNDSIYNQSKNVDVQAGTTSYEVTEVPYWKDN